MKRMRHTIGTATAVAASFTLCLTLMAVVIAQPPGPGGPPHEFRPPPDPIREALDTNHDHQLDAEEIKNASSALLAIDKNSDGILNHDELRPPAPPEIQGRGERGPEQNPRRGPAGPAGPGGPPRPLGGEGRGPRDVREGRGGPGGPPSPERLVEHAFTFDADGDGKLSRDEMRKYAEEMGRMRGGADSRRPERAPGRGGPVGDRDPADPDSTQSESRPERP